MITGDMRATAEAIARQLGFFDPLVHGSISGAEVSRALSLLLRLFKLYFYHDLVGRYGRKGSG